MQLVAQPNGKAHHVFVDPATEISKIRTALSKQQINNSARYQYEVR